MIFASCLHFHSCKWILLRVNIGTLFGHGTYPIIWREEAIHWCFAPPFRLTKCFLRFHEFIRIEESYHFYFIKVYAKLSAENYSPMHIAAIVAVNREWTNYKKSMTGFHLFLKKVIFFWFVWVWICIKLSRKIYAY